jgi:flagella basal body P-ring formation protein FlgA
MSEDLARAVPAFAAIPHYVPLAPSPAAGGMRVFPVSELQSLAARFSLPAQGLAEACFRFSVQPLDRERVIAAMRKELRIPDVKIELLETNPASVPVGEIAFRREELAPPAASDRKTPVMWHGDILYGGDKHFGIWARVILTAPALRLVAVEELRTGVPVRANQVRAELVEGFPGPVNEVTVDQIVGLLPVRSVLTGGEIRLDNLVRPNDVNRGDSVLVEVQIGGAHLSLTGKAESAGHVGDFVAIRNPETSKVFRAMIKGSGKVLVESPGSE